MSLTAQAASTLYARRRRNSVTNLQQEDKS
jgi:hypothetical protein